MADLLKKGSDILEQTFEAMASQSVTYRKIDGTQDEAIILATIGTTTADTNQGQNLRIEADVQDFIIRMSTPVDDETTFEEWLGRDPLNNDAILWDGVRYLVTAKPGGREVFRFTDGYRTSIRIHTKAAGTV